MRSAVAWVPVAIIATWTVVRLTGAERGYPLFPLMAFTPSRARRGRTA